MTPLTRGEGPHKTLLFVLAIACVLMTALAGHAQDETPQPNILVLVADDMGWEDNSLYGARNVQTPNLEALAADGVVVETAILTAPSCSPSRISLLTGLHPHQTGAEDMHIPLPERFDILPRHLAAVGYKTGHMKKTHYGAAAEAQFDWYSDDLTDFPQFLDEAGAAPFFMWVGFNDPHRPYGDGDPAPDENVSGAEPDAFTVAPEEVTVRPHLADAPGTRRELANYYSEIKRLDANIGWFIAQLDQRGLLDNTLIVFLTDNGAPLPREKTSLYDAGIRTPFVASWPARLPQGERLQGLVSVIDFAPTVLDAAGVPKPPIMEGESLLPVLTGQTAPARQYAFSQRNWHGQDAHVRSVRTEDYKLILNAYVDKSQPYGCCLAHSLWDLLALRDQGALSEEQSLHFHAPRARVELYYLPDDPNEYNNVAGAAEHGPKAQELARILNEWRQDTDDFPYWRRRREDTSDRETGVLFKSGVPAFIDGTDAGQ